MRPITDRTYRLFDGAEQRWALPPQTDVTISQVVGKQNIVCIYLLIIDLGEPVWSVQYIVL